MDVVVRKEKYILQKQRKYVALRVDGASACVTLNRPEKANAYNSNMLDEMESTIEMVLKDEAIKVLLFASSSKNFCAGADLNDITHRTSGDILNLKSRRLFEALHNAPIVTIAAVNGSAVAGGFELALACDFILASENAQFWLPEVKLGLIPAAGGISRIVQQVGPMLAKEIIICGRKLDAYEGYKYGLVTKVVRKKELRRETFELAKVISDLPSSAVKIAKISINEALSDKKSSLDLFGQVYLNELRANQKIS